MADMKKERKIEIQKFENLENKKDIFDEIKDIFHIFLNLGSHLPKKIVLFASQKTL